MSERKHYEVKFRPMVICNETEETIDSTVQSLIEEGAIVYTIKEIEVSSEDI